MSRNWLPIVAVWCCSLGSFVAPVSLHAEAPAKVAGLLTPFVEKHELAGAVALVVDREKVLAVESVGFADIGEKKPITADSMFWIASQTKPITATGVLMLVDEGKIKLDDPVEKYLPEFRGQMVVAEKDGEHVLLKKPSRPVTIRDVLSHMSGLPFKSAAEEPTLDGLLLATAVRTYAMTPLQTEPGTKYQYSNAGINTAARIIEVVTKQKYEDFMQERLFTPLGMKDTTFWPNEEQAARVAKSYRPNKEKTDLEAFPVGQLIYPLTDRAHRYPMPAGGLFSTANDVGIYCQMLLNNGELNGKRYLSEDAIREHSTRQTPTTVKDSYGLGFSVGGDFFGHGGAHATNMEIRPKQGIAVVWMVQHAGFVGDGGKAQGVFKNWAVEKFGKR
ncbi:serine hydrolase domain-containing protein [Anatilimnocola floriformis]|uniref:serine hydrolase domain-containing protein n=1 Tax=Anatilimnocola floriformis TaxID=2948575 RepID=UPI0020C3EF13|nr:serine hydrolase domain-containing protein [Anatilimnocola floriformis]